MHTNSTNASDPPLHVWDCRSNIPCHTLLTYHLEPQRWQIHVYRGRTNQPRRLVRTNRLSAHASQILNTSTRAPLPRISRLDRHLRPISSLPFIQKSERRGEREEQKCMESFNNSKENTKNLGKEGRMEKTHWRNIRKNNRRERQNTHSRTRSRLSLSLNTVTRSLTD